MPTDKDSYLSQAIQAAEAASAAWVAEEPSPGDNEPATGRAAIGAPPPVPPPVAGSGDPWDESSDRPDVEEMRRDLELLREQFRTVNRRTIEARAQACAGDGPDRVPREAWVWGRCIANGDRLVRAYVLEQFRVRFGTVQLGQLARSIFEPGPDGHCRYDFGDECARRQLARAVVLRLICRPQRARTMHGSRSRKLVDGVRGVPQRLFQKMLCRSSGRPFCRKTMSRDATRLHDLGVATRIRVPVSAARPWEIGASGQVVNRYLLRRREAKRTRGAKRELTTLGASVDIPGVGASEFGECVIAQRLVRRPRPRPQARAPS